MVDKGLVDQNVFAGRNCRQGDGLLGGRGSRDIDCIDVGAGQQAIVTLNRRDTRACFVDFVIASAMTPAIMPVPTMPNPS